MEQLDDTTETEKELCIDCGRSIVKPQPVQISPFFSVMPACLCVPCFEIWRWREQICVHRCPYKQPQGRPKKEPS